MRYPKDHGQQTRRRIVESASYGLRQNGANGLSVVDLMKLAGLTHGSFYVYFESRDALVVEALAWPWIEPSPIGWILRRDCLPRKDSTQSSSPI